MRVLNLLSDAETHFRVEVTEEERPLNDEEYFEFCTRNPDLRIERQATGEIVIVPPAGAETAYRNSDLTAQLAVWSKQDGCGRAFASNTQYMLPDGSALSPDAPGY